MDKRNNSACAKDVTETQNAIQNLEVRILRSRTAKKPPSDSVDTLVKQTAKRIRRKRPTKSGPEDELSRIQKKIKYFFSRIRYHKFFVEAYARKGWKNQSVEKIKPEKELERANGDITWYKLKVREAVQNLDYLLTVGKPDEYLFDSEGNISWDDVFCATCNLQDDTLNNDIILCDGACKRGFHQNCLNPPLLTKDIPEEGWLCPGCAFKIHCIEVINELQGTALSIDDSWENFFPEAAAGGKGPMESDVLDLASDDSEDDDFDPNISKESSGEDGDKGSDSEDSIFTTSSDNNSEYVKEKEKVYHFGLPSEDSEDDDYDPEGPDSDKDIKEKQDESDFTSDSEKDNGKENEADSIVRQSNEFTPQTSQQSLHGLVNAQHAKVLLTPNRSSPTGQRRHYAPIINQRLYEQFRTNQYPSRVLKESLAQELGLTFRQVEKWFENRRRHIKKASIKTGTPIDNHTTKGTMLENPNVCKSDAVNEDTPSEILSEGITTDGLLKQGICGGMRTNASPSNRSPKYTFHYVKRRKGESSKGDHVNNTSSCSARLPKGIDAESAVLALEVVDEKKGNKMLQELQKKKIG